MTEDGKHISFSGVALSPRADINVTVEKTTDAQGNVIWKIRREDDSLEVYDARGAKISKTTRDGQTTTYTYQDFDLDSDPNTEAQHLLVRITSFSGRSLNFAYNTLGQMITMTDPAGGVYTYTYDVYNNS